MTWICATCGLSVENAAPCVYVEGRAWHLPCANATFRGCIDEYKLLAVDEAKGFKTVKPVEAKGCAK